MNRDGESVPRVSRNRPRYCNSVVINLEVLKNLERSKNFFARTSSGIILALYCITYTIEGTYMITKKLERTLNRALKEAQDRNHDYVCLEHLLYALVHEKEAVGAIINCGGDINRLRKSLVEFFQITPRRPFLKVGLNGIAQPMGRRLKIKETFLFVPADMFFPVATVFLDS